jgi:hypothetical protein
LTVGLRAFGSIDELLQVSKVSFFAILLVQQLLVQQLLVQQQ